MSDTMRYHVAGDDDGIRLDRWFKRHRAELPHALLSRWIRQEQVTLNGERTQTGARLSAGDIIVCPKEAPKQPPKAFAKAKRAPLGAQETDFIRSLVIYRDDDAIVINKPPGLATQGGSKTHAHVDGLLDGLLFEREDRPRLVHRLDKDTSGVLLLARSARAAGYFSRAFSGRSARKIYWALVIGMPKADEGLITAPLAKMPGTGGEKMTVNEEQGQSARTRFRVVERAGNKAAWLELQPLTGRTHQLRVHCAQVLGCPIVGDGKYGGREAYLTGMVSRKLHLHAHSLTIDHPSGTPLNIAAALPPHMVETWTNMGFDVGAVADLEPIGAAFDPLADGATPSTDKRGSGYRKASASAARQRRGERRTRQASPKGDAPRGGSANSRKTGRRGPKGRRG